MRRKIARTSAAAALVLCPALASSVIPGEPFAARAQSVDDGSDSTIGKDETRMILSLIRKTIENSSDAKVTVLRRSKGSIICGSVNVKNKDGLYLGERGFVVDLSVPSFGRVPEGAELLSPRDAGFAEKERIRQLYFAMCLD